MTQVLKREFAQLICFRLNHVGAVGLKNNGVGGDTDGQSKAENQQQEENSNYDMVGPIDPISNIRPLRLRQPTSEAVSEMFQGDIYVYV